MPSNLKKSTKLIDVALILAAAESNMIVKLHVDNGCQDGVDVPLKNLLVSPRGRDNRVVNQLSYFTLRRLALATLFRYEQPSGTIPEYAMKNFDTHFSCMNGDDNIVLRNANDLLEALERASEGGLVDDNNGIILEIHCTFTNNFELSEGTLLENASKAKKNVDKTMKSWVKNISSIVQRFSNPTEDFVVVQDTNCKLLKQNRLNWAHRLATLLFFPDNFGKHKKYEAQETTEVKDSNSKLRNRDVSAEWENALDTVVDIFAGHITKLSNVLADAYDRREEVSGDIVRWFQRFAPKDTSLAPSVCSMSKGSIASVSSDEAEEIDVDRGVEIEFDPLNASSEEEWKIFFSGINDGLSQVEKDRGVVVEAPSADDVISFSSSSEGEIETINKMDDDSWSLLS